MKRNLTKSFAKYPSKLSCLNCNTTLQEYRSMGDSWGWPCHCFRCGLDHEFINGGTVDTEYALYAVFNPAIHKPKNYLVYIFLRWAKPYYKKVRSILK